MRRGEGILRWKGALADGGAALRRTVAGVLALACIAMSFTQLGFLGIGLADGGSVYLVLMLAPVALSAMLLGTLWGAAMGLFGGAALYLHAVALPLDYYELTFVTPVTSVAMLCAAGLLLGALFALALRGGRAGWRRVAAVAAACLAASLLFSAGFAAGAVAALAQDVLSALGGAEAQAGMNWIQVLRDAFFANIAPAQALGDFALMALVSCLGLSCAERGLRAREGMGLRMGFAVRLSAAVLAAFMVSATAAYVAITADGYSDAAEDMRSEVDYLAGQMNRAAAYNGKVTELLLSGAEDPESRVDGLAELLEHGALGDLLAGYTEEADGLVVASVAGYVSGTDAERLAGRETLAECFDGDVLAAVERSIAQGTLERVVYEGPSSGGDLITLALTGAGEAGRSRASTRQLGYLMATDVDGYRAVMVRPAGMVFAGRYDAMLWLSLSSLVLLLAVYAIAWRLLDRMVARRIDATNAALSRVTEGDLDARVAREGSLEFKELADGINGTVGALRGWIAEAETRMDAELATAKAIQAAALPRVFPPYPDILRFDVYASMDAAREVGGDFYDFFLIGEDCNPDAGKLGFVIADVSGKGVPAALFMMKAMTQLRDYMQSGMELGEAVENANRMLCEGNDAGMFVTAWAGVLDYGSYRVDFVNAGHNPPLLWSMAGEGDGAGGSWRWLKEKSGLPLGLFDGLPYTPHSVECRAGDQFLLYTDGVTEAMSADGELYGEGRLEDLAKEGYTLHPRDLVASVRRSVAAHAAGAEQSDDITVLALEVGVPPAEKMQLVVPAEVGELPHVNEFIHAELDRRLCPLRAQNQLDIAVEELFVNVCHYAYEGMPEDVARTVRVTCAYSAEPVSITVEIIDSGVPYDPLAKPDAATADEFGSVADIPIGGLGILMAKNSVDEMRYERMGESNVVTVVKKW